MRKIVAFIPVRGGSKGIPHKNVKMVADKPLVMWTAEAAAECSYIDRVYVATDSLYIAGIVTSKKRHKKISCISAKKMDDLCMQETPMLDFAKNYKWDDIVLIQATSPLLRAEDLSGGMRMYMSGAYDSVISVVRKHQFMWNEKGPVNYNPQKRPRRQEWDGLLIENGAFFITSRSRFLGSGCRMSGSVGLYEMPEETYYEIDTLMDLKVVECLLKERINV